MNDLEERLRATYRAVAEQTVVAEELPPTHTVQPTAFSIRSRRPVWVGLGVAASLLAVLVVVLTTRRPTDLANSASDRTIAVPLHVPPGFGVDEAGSTGRGGIPGFDGLYDGIHLVSYRGPGLAHFVVAATGRGSGQPMAGDLMVTLFSGVDAWITRDVDITTIAWAQPNGPIVGIKASSALSDEELVNLANSIWYVTPSMFGQLTARGGFAEVALDRWEVPGDGSWRTSAQFVGSLQLGLALRFDSGLGLSTIADVCVVATAESSRLRHAVLLGDGTVTSFAVTGPEGERVTIAGAHPPGVPTMTFALAARGTDLECMRGGR